MRCLSTSRKASGVRHVFDTGKNHLKTSATTFTPVVLFVVKPSASVDTENGAKGIRTNIRTGGVDEVLERNGRMNPEKKKQRGRERVLSIVRNHLRGCHICLGYRIFPEHLAKELGIENRGHVEEALKVLVKEGWLRHANPLRPWWGRSYYYVRRDKRDVILGNHSHGRQQAQSPSGDRLQDPQNV